MFRSHRLAVSLLLVVFVARGAEGAATAAASPASWDEPWMGVSDGSGGIATATGRVAEDWGSTMAVAGGVPYIAWRESNGTNRELRVARLNGSSWEQPWAGGSATSGGVNRSAGVSVSAPTMTAVGNVPYVAWVDLGRDDWELRVARWNGSIWEQPWAGASALEGAVTQFTRYPERPALAAVDGVPYVTWIDAQQLTLRVARLNGSVWEQPWVGVSESSGGVTTGAADGSPTLAGVGRVPYVAWVEFDRRNYELRIARLDGMRWKQPWKGVSRSYGGVNRSSASHAGDPSIADVRGVPHVAWTERAHLRHGKKTAQLRVARLDRRRWEQPWRRVSDIYGGINHSRRGSWAHDPSLARIAGVPHVAWTETGGVNRELRVARLGRKRWVQPWRHVTDTYGGINHSMNARAAKPSLAAVRGAPHVAWVERLGRTGWELRVARAAREP